MKKILAISALSATLLAQSNIVDYDIEALFQKIQSDILFDRYLFYDYLKDTQNLKTALILNYIMAVGTPEGDNSCPGGGRVISSIDGQGFKHSQYYNCCNNDQTICYNGKLTSKIKDENGNLIPEILNLQASNLQIQYKDENLSANLNFPYFKLDLQEQNNNDMFPINFLTFKPISPYDINLTGSIDAKNLAINVQFKTGQTREYTIGKINGSFEQYSFDHNASDSKTFDYQRLKIAPGFEYIGTEKNNAPLHIVLNDGLLLELDQQTDFSPCIFQNIQQYVSGKYKLDIPSMIFEYSSAKAMKVHSEGYFINVDENNDSIPEVIEINPFQNSHVIYINALGTHKEFNISSNKICFGEIGKGEDGILTKKSNGETPLKYDAYVTNGTISFKYSNTFDWEGHATFDNFKVSVDDQNSETDDELNYTINGKIIFQDNRNLQIPTVLNFSTPHPIKVQDTKFAPYQGEYKVNDSSFQIYTMNNQTYIKIVKNGSEIYNGPWNEIYTRSSIFHLLKVINNTPNMGKIQSDPILFYFNYGTTYYAGRFLNEKINLIAVPDPGYAVDHWDGDCASCDHQAICPVVMDDNKICEITFKRQKAIISVPVYDLKGMFLIIFLILFAGATSLFKSRESSIN